MSRISRKNQITLPVSVLEAAGLHSGDDVVVRATGPGRVEVTRGEDLIEEYAGMLTGAYPEGYLDDLRSEWR